MVYNGVQYVQNRKIDDVFYFAHLITMENFTPTYFFHGSHRFIQERRPQISSLMLVFDDFRQMNKKIVLSGK